MRNNLQLITALFVGLSVVFCGSMLVPWAVESGDPEATALPDLAIFKYKESGIFAPGREVKYAFYFVNQSMSVANDVRIVDVMAPHTTYVSSSQPGFVLIQAGPDEVVWVKDRLSDFEMGWLSLTVRVDEDAPVGGWLEDTASILCLDAEGDSSNNAYSVSARVLPEEPDLAVRKGLYAGSSVPGPGQRITYEILAKNQGGSDAHSVRITDTLPAGTTYVTTTNSCGYTVTQTGSTVVWETDTVSADSSCEYPGIFLDVQLAGDFDPSEDWLDNVVEISTVDTEANVDNNRNRYLWKSEPGPYGAAVTSVDDETMQLLNEGGFDWMIYYLDWSKTEPEDGSYWWRDVDDAAWKAWWYHKKLAVRVDRAPAWARGSGTSSAPPADPDTLRDFLQAVASGERQYTTNGPVHHVPKIDAFIVWNEPNLAAEWGGNAPDAASYTALLQAAYNGVKAGDPSALVISAGLATNSGGSDDAVDDRAFLQGMLDNGACSFFDQLGANPLGFASSPDDLSDPNGYDFSRARELRAVLIDNGCAKDLFAAEMGWLRDTTQDLGGYNWMKVSEIDQAHYLARAYHKARREWSWMGPMATWNLDFARFYSDIDQMHWFGIIDGEGAPLRSYLTLKNAANGGPADLWVEKELSGTVAPGENLSYVIDCKNIGGQPASSVLMTDTMPNHTSYVSDSRGDGVVVDGEVTWDIGAMDTGARETITLTLLLEGTVSPDVFLENTVAVSPQTDEPYLDDNVASVFTGTLPLPTPPVLTSPEPGQVVTTTTPTLIWQAAEGEIAGYLLDFAGSVVDVGETLRYTSTLLADGNYTWTLASYDVLSQTGAYTDTWSFSVDTTGPEVLQTVPSDAEIDIPIGTALVISFSEPVDAPTFASVVVPDPGGWGQTWSASGSIVTLTHNVLVVDDVYSATVVSASDPYGNPMPGPYGWSFTAGGEVLYLPLLERKSVLAPDLTVDRLEATTQGVRLTIRNRGNSTVTEDFWVDVSFDPRTKPPHINQPWSTIADQGAVWGVTVSIGPGESLDLETGGDYYYGSPTSSPPPYTEGQDVYAYVDSVDWSTSWGAVWESDEGNNTIGAIVSIGSGSPAVARQGWEPSGENGLPRR